MDLTDIKQIRQKVDEHCDRASELRQSLNQVAKAYEQACSKETKDIEKTRKFLEDSMAEMQQKLCDSIYLLEFYYIKLWKKRPSKQNDKELIARTMEKMREVLLSAYHGTYFAKNFDPADSYTETKGRLEDERYKYFERGLVTQDPDLVQAALELKQNANDLMLLNQHEMYPIEYAVACGNPKLVSVLCEYGVKVDEVTFKRATEKDIFVTAALLRGGYPFGEDVLGYVIQQWEEIGFEAIDYLIAEEALNERNLACFRESLHGYHDLIYRVIIGDLGRVIEFVTSLDPNRKEDQTLFCQALSFAARGGREEMTRQLLHTKVMDTLLTVHKFDDVLVTLRDVAKQREKTMVMIEKFATEKGISLAGKSLDVAEEKSDRSVLKTSIDLATENAEKEILRLREYAKSWFSLGDPGAKADGIEAALHRAQKSGVNSSAAFYQHKEGSLPSLKEALARPRIGFFQATAANNVEAALKEQRQEQEKVAEVKNGM